MLISKSNVKYVIISMGIVVVMTLTYVVIQFLSLSRDKQIVLHAYSLIAPYKSVIDEYYVLNRQCPTDTSKLIPDANSLLKINQSSETYLQQVHFVISDIGHCIIDSIFIDEKYSNRLKGKKISLQKNSAKKWVCFSQEINSELLPKSCSNFTEVFN